MDIVKVIYWGSTGLMCLLFLFSAGMYLTNYDVVSGVFEQLGFPTWIIYPLAVAKILGVVAVLTKASRLLKEWAYAGFFFDAVLAFGAHWMIEDGGHIAAVVAIVLVLVSRFYDEKLFGVV